MPCGGDDDIIYSAPQLIQLSSELFDTNEGCIRLVTTDLSIGSNDFPSIYQIIFHIKIILIKKWLKWCIFLAKIMQKKGTLAYLPFSLISKTDPKIKSDFQVIIECNHHLHKCL